MGCEPREQAQARQTNPVQWNVRARWGISDGGIWGAKKSKCQRGDGRSSLQAASKRRRACLDLHVGHGGPDLHKGARSQRPSALKRMKRRAIRLNGVVRIRDCQKEITPPVATVALSVRRASELSPCMDRLECAKYTLFLPG